MPSSRRSSWPRDWTRVSCIASGFLFLRKKVKSLSCIQLLATPQTVAQVEPKALPFMEFSRQEYWRGLPFPSPQVDSLPLSHREGRGSEEAPMGLPGKGEEHPPFWRPRALLQYQSQTTFPQTARPKPLWPRPALQRRGPGGPRGSGGATRISEPDQQVPHRLGVHR